MGIVQSCARFLIAMASNLLPMASNLIPPKKRKPKKPRLAVATLSSVMSSGCVILDAELLNAKVVAP